MIRIIESNKKITINFTLNDIETYRCIFKNITRKLIQKFNFVTKKNFFKFIQKN